MAQKTKTVSIIEYFLVQGLKLILTHLPYPMALRVGDFCGLLIFALWKKRRELTRRNLSSVLAEKSPREIKRLAKAVFKNIGKTLVEFIYTENWDKTELLGRIEIEGRQYLDEALAKGKGVILLAAHFGNWEILGIALSALEYKVKVIARPLDNPRLDHVVNGIRSKFGEEIIANRNGIKEVIKCLHRNEVVGILIDQNFYENAVFVEFLKKTAATTPIIPLLSQKTGAAIIPIHIIRLENGRHRLIIEGELQLKQSADRQEFTRINTRLCNAVIESWIYQHPDQWFWVHNRWKTQPPKEITK